MKTYQNIYLTRNYTTQTRMQLRPQINGCPMTLHMAEPYLQPVKTYDPVIRA